MHTNFKRIKNENKMKVDDDDDDDNVSKY